MKTNSELDRKLIRLMRDFGYYANAGSVYSMPIGGYPAQFVRHCRDIFDAADQLCPIIADSEYTDRFVKLANP